MQRENPQTSTTKLGETRGVAPGRIRDEWQSLGLKEETNYQDRSGPIKMAQNAEQGQIFRIFPPPKKWQDLRKSAGKSLK